MLKIEYKGFLNPYTLSISMANRDSRGKFVKQFKDYICSICGSDKTYIHIKNNHSVWHKHPETGLAVCGLCHSRNFINRDKKRQNGRRYWDKHREELNKKQCERFTKRILFKDKYIQLDFNPRQGICSYCNVKGYTHMHHEKYDENNPLAHTIELCVSCHAKETWKTRKEREKI